MKHLMEGVSPDPPPSPKKVERPSYKAMLDKANERIKAQALLIDELHDTIGRQQAELHEALASRDRAKRTVELTQQDTNRLLESNLQLQGEVEKLKFTVQGLVEAANLDARDRHFTLAEVLGKHAWEKAINGPQSGSVSGPNDRVSVELDLPEFNKHLQEQIKKIATEVAEAIIKEGNLTR